MKKLHRSERGCSVFLGLLGHEGKHVFVILWKLYLLDFMCIFSILSLYNVTNYSYWATYKGEIFVRWQVVRVLLNPLGQWKQKWLFSPSYYIKTSSFVPSVVRCSSAVCFFRLCTNQISLLVLILFNGFQFNCVKLDIFMICVMLTTNISLIL